MIRKYVKEFGLLCEEMIPPQRSVLCVILIQKATAAPAAPQVSGRVIHVSFRIPRSTHCLLV